MNNINQTATINKSKRMKTIDLVMTGMFTAILVVMAQITIPTHPIPFTLSLFAVFLIGALLSPRYAFLSVIVYLLLGAFGVPVFSKMNGGIGYLTKSTGGYLMAYPIMAFITSLFYKYSKKFKVPALACGMLISLFLCYLLGTLWFTKVSGMEFNDAIKACVYPFIPFDLVKIALAVSISTVIRKTVMKTINI